MLPLSGSWLLKWSLLRICQQKNWQLVCFNWRVKSPFIDGEKTWEKLSEDDHQNTNYPNPGIHQAVSKVAFAEVCDSRHAEIPMHPIVRRHYNKNNKAQEKWKPGAKKFDSLAPISNCKISCNIFCNYKIGILSKSFNLHECEEDQTKLGRKFSGPKNHQRRLGRCHVPLFFLSAASSALPEQRLKEPGAIHKSSLSQGVPTLLRWKIVCLFFFLGGGVVKVVKLRSDIYVESLDVI